MIHLEGVFKSFVTEARTIPVLQGVDLDIAQGEIFGIVGHSGAGKSTLIRLVNRLEKVSSGRIVVNDVDITTLQGDALRQLRQSMGMVFQHFNLLSSRTVAENIAMPLRIAGTRSKQTIAERVDQLLALVGLEAQKNQYPAQLSGGQKQRVGIARALANRPQILLCDEATSALDPETTRSILQLLAKINQKLGLTILLITHEMDAVRMICDRVAVMDQGQIVESGPVREVFLHPQHPTTRQFVHEAERDENIDEPLPEAEGRVVRLTLVGSTMQQPLWGQLGRYGIDFSILSGRIEQIKDMHCGQLTLALRGEDTAIAQALHFLSDHQVHVEELRT